MIKFRDLSLSLRVMLVIAFAYVGWEIFLTGLGLFLIATGA
jgi:hypothetical protein